MAHGLLVVHRMWKRIVTAMLVVGCGEGGDDTLSAEGELRAGEVRFVVGTVWNCGENAEPDQPGSGVRETDNGLEAFRTVTFGPVSECEKDRPSATAKCKWEAPPKCWTGSLVVKKKGAVTFLEASAYTGDFDSSWSSSMPLSSIPTLAPWEISVSPDSAGGGYGDIAMSIKRVAGRAGSE